MNNVIETPRCVMRPVVEADRNDMLSLHQNESVRRYLGGVVDQKRFESRFSLAIRENVGRNWTIRTKEDAAFIGNISIGVHHEGQSHEISYQLMPEFWGQGLAFEVARAILNHASTGLRLSSIVAETQEANARSKRLLEKLGMVPIQTVVRFGEKQQIYLKEF